VALLAMLAMGLVLAASPAEAAPFAYVTNSFPIGTVSVIDTATNPPSVVATVTLPAGNEPTEIAVTPDGTRAYVTNSNGLSGIVSVIDTATNTVAATVPVGFNPQGVAVTPDGKYAYVTDDGSGELTVIGLDDRRLISRVFVGVGAHHLAFTPGERQVWVALGQAAQTLALLSTVTRSGTVDLGRPHVIGHFDPAFLVHDLLFSPGGEQVWITSADTSYVGVFSARTHRLLFRVPAGAPPQHLVFANGYAYITSGYGSSIEQVDPHSGHVVRRVPAPYGSFDLDAADDYVVTASLFRGTLAIYGRRLRLLRISKLASSTEDVALSAP